MALPLRGSVPAMSPSMTSTDDTQPALSESSARGAPSGATPLPSATRPTPRFPPWVPWSLLAMSVVVLPVVSYAAFRASSRATAFQVEMRRQRGALRDVTRERDLARTRGEEHRQTARRLDHQLEQAKADERATQQATEAARRELIAQLEEEIARGNIFVEQRGSHLVIDVSNQLLFGTGQAEIHRAGKSVLLQVARCLNRLPGFVFQVGGHTDAERIVSAGLRRRFPTNWELSTARATHVVRYLSGECGVPGERLVAAGFASFRPVASNATREGRARNRRIEILLLPATAESTPAGTQ